MWRLKLFLRDGKTHELGDVLSGMPGWAECQPGGILKIQFSFVGNTKGKNIPLCIILSGMEKYNFFIEATKAIGGNKIHIKGIWILGKIPNENKIEGFLIANNVEKINTFEGKEYRGTPTLGWKEGILGEKVGSFLQKL